MPLSGLQGYLAHKKRFKLKTGVWGAESILIFQGQTTRFGGNFLKNTRPTYGFILTPSLDFELHLAKTRLRTGVHCSPESDAPRSFLAAPHSFPKPSCSSRSCSLLALDLSIHTPLLFLCGPHEAVVAYRCTSNGLSQERSVFGAIFFLCF